MLPDYYKILRIPPGASQKEVREGYRRESLKTHPDRVPPEKSAKATADFQAVADAYYVLSDPTRRSNYDAQRSAGGFDSTSPDASAEYFTNFFRSAFSQAGPSASQQQQQQEDEDDRVPPGGFNEGARPDPEATFGDVFEDLLRPEVQRRVPMWTWLGAASGAVLGFIVGNLPGAAIGGYGGSRVGAIRDAKGKAVYEVFKDLGADQRAQIIKGLAMKVLGSAMS